MLVRTPVGGYGLPVFHDARSPCGYMWRRANFRSMLLAEVEEAGHRPCSSCGHQAKSPAARFGSLSASALGAGRGENSGQPLADQYSFLISRFSIGTSSQSRNELGAWNPVPQNPKDTTWHSFLVRLSRR